MHHRFVGLVEDRMIDVAGFEKEIARSVDDCLVGQDVSHVPRRDLSDTRSDMVVWRPGWEDNDGPQSKAWCERIRPRGATQAVLQSGSSIVRLGAARARWHRRNAAVQRVLPVWVQRRCPQGG